MTPKDVDLEAGSIRVLRGKGGRARTMGIDPAAWAVVATWLAARIELGLDGQEPVLCTLAHLRRHRGRRRHRAGLRGV